MAHTQGKTKTKKISRNCPQGNSSIGLKDRALNQLS